MKIERLVPAATARPVLLQGRESIAKQCSTGIVRATVGLTLTTNFGFSGLVEVPETDAQAIDKIGRDRKSQGYRNQ